MPLLTTSLTMRKQHVVKEVHRVAICTTITSLVFWAFFAWSKTQPFAGVNPFAVDLYDAIGSLAFQIAVALSIVSLARSFQQRKNTNSLHRLPFMLRGIGIALCATVITMVGDGIAVAKQYDLVMSSMMGGYLLIGLGIVAFFTLLDGILFIKGVPHGLESCVADVSSDKERRPVAEEQSGRGCMDKSIGTSLAMCPGCGDCAWPPDSCRGISQRRTTRSH